MVLLGTIIIALFSTGTVASGICPQMLDTNSKPEAMPAPAKPQVIPEKEPETLPTPAPKRVPNPLPQRQPKRTEDPKDLVITDLYLRDEASKPLLSLLPGPYLQSLPEVAHDIRAALEEKIEKEFGRSDQGHLSYLKRDISARIRILETKHYDALIELIKTQLYEFYGAEFAEKVELRLRDARPRIPKPDKQDTPPVSMSDRLRSAKEQLKRIFNQKAKPPKDADKKSVSKSDDTPLEDGYFEDLILRREIYNLLAQAEGWKGMELFVHYYSDKIAAIDPELPDLYRKLDLLFRLNQFYLAESFVSTTGLNRNKTESWDYGREIVSADHNEITDGEGNSFLDISNAQAVAFGQDAYALAHEASKAAFQLATIAESSRRAGLNQKERKLLDDITNSGSAEIRQGIFGQRFNQNFKYALDLLAYPNGEDRLDRREYLAILDTLFIQPPEIFQAIIYGMSSSTFLINKHEQAQLRAYLKQHKIL